MNTPNKLTVGRMIATPIFMATMLIDFPFHYAVSLVLFIVASLTDMIDGKWRESIILLPILVNLWIRLLIKCLQQVPISALCLYMVAVNLLGI